MSPSKTAIVPVKTDFLPSSVSEREAMARTVRAAGLAVMGRAAVGGASGGGGADEGGGVGWNSKKHSSEWQSAM